MADSIQFRRGLRSTVKPLPVSMPGFVEDEDRLIIGKGDGTNVELPNVQDINNINLESTGYGVINGLNVLAQDTPNMTVKAIAGKVHMPSGKSFTPSSNTALAIMAADSTKPRTDIVYVNKDGVISYLESALGTAAVAGKETYTMVTKPVGKISGSREYTLDTNFAVGDTVEFDGITFTAVSSGASGNQFNVGADITTSATNLASALNANNSVALTYLVTSNSNVITITEKSEWSGNTPSSMTVTGTGAITNGSATISKAADTITINGITFTAVNSGAIGNQFNIDESVINTVANLASVLNANPTINSKFTATSDNTILALTEKVAGGGNTPTISTTMGTVSIVNGTVINSSVQIYPTAPNVPDGGMLLYEIKVGAGVTSIINSNIIDKRIFKLNNNQLAEQNTQLSTQMAENTNQINNLNASKAEKAALDTTNANVADNTTKISQNITDINTNITVISAQKSRIDNLVQTSSAPFYQKSTSGTTGVLLVVSSGATTGQINLASVTPAATGYTPAVGDYVLLVYGVASGSSELIDGRIGANGVTYANIGDGIRTQIADLNEYVKFLNIDFSVEIGSINSLNGSDIDTVTNRARTSYFEADSTVSLNLNIHQCFVFIYDMNKNYISSTPSWTSSYSSFRSGFIYRLAIRKSTDEDLSNSLNDIKADVNFSIDYDINAIETIREVAKIDSIYNSSPFTVQPIERYNTYNGNITSGIFNIIQSEVGRVAVFELEKDGIYNIIIDNTISINNIAIGVGNVVNNGVTLKDVTVSDIYKNVYINSNDYKYLFVFYGYPSKQGTNCEVYQIISPYGGVSAGYELTGSFNLSQLTSTRLTTGDLLTNDYFTILCNTIISNNAILTLAQYSDDGTNWTNYNANGWEAGNAYLKRLDKVHQYIHVLFKKVDDSTISTTDVYLQEYTINSKSVSNLDEITIASCQSSLSDKVNADYVCTGSNDENVIQTIINNGTHIINLLAGNYYFDNFHNGSTSTEMSCVFVALNGIIRGRYKWSVNIYVAFSAFSSIPAGEEVCVFNADTTTRNILFSHGYENFNVYVMTNTNNDHDQNITVINNRRIGSGNIKDVFLYYNGSSNYPYKLTEGSVGITGYCGDCQGAGNIWNSVRAFGFYEGFQLGSEHLVGTNLLARDDYYGYTFGNYTHEGDFAHPVTLINCCDEHCVASPLFVKGGQNGSTGQGRQQIDFISFNMEVWNSSNPLNLGYRIPAKELNLDDFRGNISYSVNGSGASSTSSINNIVDFKFWDDGSGHGFKTVNASHQIGGTTAERLTYIPNYMQEYYDTDLKKKLIYDGTNWVDCNGTIVSAS